MNPIIYLLFLTVGFLMGRLTKPIKITITTTAEGEESPTPAIKVPNPMQAYKDHKERKAEEEELKKLERINENLERYDGTGEGQKDI